VPIGIRNRKLQADNVFTNLDCTPRHRPSSAEAFRQGVKRNAERSS
jgi:hypothetical protein